MINRKALIRLILIASGAGMIFLSLFAFQLGLDNNPGWGPRRFQILGTGIAIVLFGSLYWITPAISRWLEISYKPTLMLSSSVPGMKSAVKRINAWFERSILDSKWVGSIKGSQWLSWVSRNHVNLWLMVLACFLLWSYVWIITIGRMDRWPSGRNYYWMLTQAFQRGQTSLLIEPNPELLKLQNPYDLSQRKGLDYLWDTTLYNGKYYLYWGPVPAVLGVLFNLITSKPVSDAGFVFSFVIGAVLFSVLLLKKLCQDYHFSDVILWGGVFSSAVNIPLIWLFTHPAYYEAAIVGGQFFMMAGFFLLYLALRSSSIHQGYLMLSALALGLAGGTRISLLPSVIFLAFLILWRVYVVRGRNLHSSVSGFAATLIPLAIIAGSLCWYNYIRFGSIFEFGHRYQLTGLASTPDEKDQLSIRYVIPNLYSYVFRSPSLIHKFPFITVPAIKQSMWPSFIHLPENYYYSEPIAGVVLIVPLIGFTVLILVRFFWLVANGDFSLQRIGNTADNIFIWFGTSLFGYVLIQTCVLLLYVSSSMRYLFDVLPELIILASMFVGMHIQSIEKSPGWSKVILCLWISAAVLTVISGFLIGITGAQNNFLNKNPHLYYQLVEWFSH